jgi:tRNA-specific 2-thiouridylase
MENKKRVVVGLSGGVDSSVTAHLLKEQGYEVIGLFMKNWHDDSVTISDECPWLEDSNDAMIVAEKLGIPFQTIDLSTDYKEKIVDYMFREYEQGRTPNPDILCNREIKFDIFMKTALSLGADYVATGHYCRKESFKKDGQTIYQLLAGKDPNKDQSYFLCQLSQEQLAKALFPVGELQKPEVREIAKKADLITADKKDSQGLCFIGKVRLPEFLQQKLKPIKGNVIALPTDLPKLSKATHPTQLPVDTRTLHLCTKAYKFHPKDGKIVGEHNGAHYFTIGQRKGLGIGGFKEPLFVLATDTERNIVYVGEGENHSGLYRSGLKIIPEEIHWTRNDLELQIGESKEYQVRIRYRQPLEKATLVRKDDGLYIIFDRKQKGIAAGQFSAWYQGEELIGSGVIN